MRVSRRRLLLGGAAAVLVALPFVLPGYRLYTVSYLAVFVTVGLGMHILVSDAGLVSLGHAGFLAIGAYATALFSLAGVPLPVAIVLGGAAAGGVGAVLARPALRLDGSYLAVVTLGFGLAVVQIAARVPALGGHGGLDLTPPRLGDLSPDLIVYVAATVTALVAGTGVYALSAGRLGRALRLGAASPEAAATVGVDLAACRTLAFAVSAAVTGVAGGVLALLVGLVSPGTFSFTLSLLFLAMVVVGGTGSVWGAVVGSALFGWLDLEGDTLASTPVVRVWLEPLSEFAMSTAGVPYVTWVVTGAVVVAVSVLAPDGVWGVVGRRARRRRRPDGA